MLTGKTESGFEFEIEEKTLDDYEFIEAVGKCEQGDPLAYVKVVDAALGSKKEKAFEKIREKCGYVSAKEITKLIVEIFQTNIPLFQRYSSVAKYSFATSKLGFSTKRSTSYA